MDLSILKEEISKEEYSGLNDQEIADAINNKTIVRNRLVQTWEIKKHAIENGYWPAIIISALSAENMQLKGLCISARDWIDDQSGKIQTIDLNLSSAQNLLGGLVAFGIITQEQANELIALSQETVSWTLANNLPEIGPGFIVSSRRS